MEYTVQDYLRQLGLDGGPGSGNWGHAGRMGKRGGSAKVKGGSAAQSGGKQFRAYEASKGYYSVKKTQHFASATKKAANTFSYNRWQRNLTDDQKNAIKTQHEHIVSASGYKQDLESYQRRIYSMMRGGAQQERRPQNKPVTITAEQACGKFMRKRAQQPSEITDVLHQTGFDGAAKVVTKKQMDEMLKADPTRPVFYRAYVAPNKETLDAYDNCAQHDAWYVQCTDGGAQYGKGMYSAGVYESGAGTRYSYKSRKQRQEGALTQMQHYLQTNKRRVQSTCTPPDDVQSISMGSRVLGIGQHHNFDDLPKQGQVVALKASRWNATYAKFQGGKFIECDQDGKVGRWPDEYSPDHLKKMGDGLFWMKKSDWKPQPVGTVRKFLLQPDAKILTLHSKYGDKKEMNALIKKANTLLKKQSLKALDKTKVRDQVSQQIDKNTYDPKSTKQQIERKIKYLQHTMKMKQDEKEQALSYGYSPDHWRVRSCQMSIHACQAQIKAGQNSMKEVDDIIKSYPTQDGFLKKIQQHRKWKALHTYLGKKACPFKQQTFTPQQQKFLAEHQETYKTGTWSKYLSFDTKDALQDNFVRDTGSAAALLGYDAINAIDHGYSGSYTVVLNRTKVIYQDEQIDPYKGVS